MLEPVRACPPAAWTLALLYLGAAAACAASAAFPMSEQAPVRLAMAVAAGSLLAGCVLLGAGRRLPARWLQGFLAAGAAISGLCVANSHLLAGVVASAFACPWLGVWAGVFLPRRDALLHGGLITAALAAGLAVARVPGSLAVGVLIAVATWGALLAFALVTGLVWRHLDTDPLTGFLNRAGLRRAADAARAAATRRGTPLTVAVIDLDGFKAINDEHGHAAGDRLLADLHRTWSPVLRAGDLIGRQGGDEFVLVLPETTPAEAGELLQRLRRGGRVDWSDGVSAWHAGEPFEDSLERADRQLYRAKRARHGAVPARRAA
jgi:diguanylate cyclase (GGDEF)-like protein